MSKITKSDLLNFIQEQADMLVELTKLVELNKRAIIKLENPQLKQADHSVFNGRADYWKFFAIDEDGQGWFYRNRPSVNEDDKRWMESNRTPTRSGYGYDASNWRDSLIKREPVPQFKQLNQSVFDGLDEKWKFAAVDRSGLVKAFTYKPKLSVSRTSFILLIGNTMDIGTGYDASNWQYSLIERDDIAKELLEVDLSSELTGSELCKAMLARGDKYVMCFVNDKDEEAAKNYKRVRVIHSHGVDYFDDTTEDMWDYAVPINSKGEPLTASDVGI